MTSTQSQRDPVVIEKGNLSNIIVNTSSLVYSPSSQAFDPGEAAEQEHPDLLAAPGHVSEPHRDVPRVRQRIS